MEKKTTLKNSDRRTSELMGLKGVGPSKRGSIDLGALLGLLAASALVGCQNSNSAAPAAPAAQQAQAQPQPVVGSPADPSQMVEVQLPSEQQARGGSGTASSPGQSVDGQNGVGSTGSSPTAEQPKEDQGQNSSGSALDRIMGTAASSEPTASNSRQTQKSPVSTQTQKPAVKAEEKSKNDTKPKNETKPKQSPAQQKPAAQAKKSQSTKKAEPAKRPQSASTGSATDRANERARAARLLKIDSMFSTATAESREGSLSTREKPAAEVVQNGTWPPRPSNQYVVIQNVATNTVRVYQMGRTASDANELVFETSANLGEINPTLTRAAVLGNYRIQDWIKLPEPQDGTFVSWARVATFAQTEADRIALGGTAQIMPPKLAQPEVDVNAEPLNWVRTGSNGQYGLMGAMGWYAADVTPKTSLVNGTFADQTLHGTIGWGADWERYIVMQNAEWKAAHEAAGLTRLNGSTRVSNPAISLMQYLLLPGTPLIRVYALEKLSKEYKPAKVGFGVRDYEYMISSDFEGARQSSLTDDVQQAQFSSLTVTKALNDVSPSTVIERGVYIADIRPDAREFTTEVGAVRSRTVPFAGANVYGIQPSEFVGHFEVDTGKLVNYRHPRRLKTLDTRRIVSKDADDPFIAQQKIPRRLSKFEASASSSGAKQKQKSEKSKVTKPAAPAAAASSTVAASAAARK